MSQTMEAPNTASASAALIPFKRVAIGAGTGWFVGLLFTLFAVTNPAALGADLALATAGACFAFLSFHRRLTAGWLAVLAGAAVGGVIGGAIGAANEPPPCQPGEDFCIDLSGVTTGVYAGAGLLLGACAGLVLGTLVTYVLLRRHSRGTALEAS
jgi:hypothetical protein